MFLHSILARKFLNINLPFLFLYSERQVTCYIWLYKMAPSTCLMTLQANCFPVLSQLSDHCVFFRKLIAYKIKTVEIYFWSPKVVEEKKKEKALKAACDQLKEHEKLKQSSYLLWNLLIAFQC